MAVASHEQQIIDRIDSARNDLIELGRFIHSHPEIALEEVESSNRAASFLEERGFSVERGIAGLATAFRATYGDGEPRIAFLAEYDALPVVGHGCGHNLIAMTAIGAGLGLAEVVGQTGGSVVVFGTPAEEAVGGKIIMAEAGVFDDIDLAMGAHPGTEEAECPTVEGSGQALASQAVTIAFHGRSAHAAADPYNGINALDALIETFNGINALRQHLKSDARIHGIVVKGGEAPNVIPDYAEGLFYVRSQTRMDMAALVERVNDIARGAALMTGATLEFSLAEHANFDMITNYPVARRLKRHMDTLAIPLREAVAAEGSGSSDWGNVSYIVPSVETEFPILEGVCTWHSQTVVEAANSDYAYQQGIAVAQAMALTGLEALTDKSVLAEARESFLAARLARGD